MKYFVAVNGKELEAEVISRSADSITFTINGTTHTVSSSQCSPALAATAQVTGSEQNAQAAPKQSPRAIKSGKPGEVKAPMPGVIVRIVAKEGETVTRGAPLIIVEAMKMENAVGAPADGVVKKVHVAAGAQVEGGALLITLG